MSTEVYIYITRKSDGCPFGKYYLGGNGTKNSLAENFRASSIETETGMDVMPFLNSQAVMRFLNNSEHCFYDGNYAKELQDDFLDTPQTNDFSYWLVWEY